MKESCLFLILCLIPLLLILVYHAHQPGEEVTADEILADGGKYVLTPDGRYIEYFICGAPANEPGTQDVYYQHGYGQTGKSIYKLGKICPAAEKLGLRIISPSQPGFGLSSHYPIGRTRRLKEWPADIRLILQKENVDKFYVSGASAGCVHAFVVAHHFQDRVLGVGVNTPTAPLSVEVGLTSMAAPTKFVRIALEYRWSGEFLAWLMAQMDPHTRMAAAPDVQKAMDKFALGEEEWMSEAHEGYVEDQARGVKKGHRGWADNMAVLNEDLPFPIEELGFVHAAGNAFVLTSAVDDTTNPPAMQLYYRDNIPGARIIERPAGFGHLHGSVPGCFEEIFREMMGHPSTEG
jgi:pimeloyl-ACP methyl ester carboxylesterase